MVFVGPSGCGKTTALRMVAGLEDITEGDLRHHYFQPVDDDRDSFPAAAVAMDRFIDAAVATCDHARAVGRHNKRINLCFDEWNVWYQREFAGEDNLHADRVRIACLAQLVNVIAPISTEPGRAAWRQTTFYPFALTSRHGRGTVLRVEPRSPVHETRSQGEVPLVDTTRSWRKRPARSRCSPSTATSRSQWAWPDVGGLPELAVGQHVTLCDQDPDAVNSATAPDRVTPSQQHGLKVADGRVEVVLPPLSWNMLRLLPADDEVRPLR